MKKHIVIWLLMLFVAPAIFSCKRDLETENISRTTFFPILTMSGDQFNSIPVGGTFTDAGVTATEGGNPINVSTNGTVDTSTPGVYTLTYTAVNKDGFSATVSRYVGVIAPDAFSADLSGTYKRTAGAQGISTVTKIAPGLYTTDNVGGVAVPGPTLTVHFYHTTGTTLVVPQQTVTGGQVFAASNASYKFATATTPAQYSWVVINSGYGTALRTFVKQ